MSPLFRFIILSHSDKNKNKRVTSSLSSGAKESLETKIATVHFCSNLIHVILFVFLWNKQSYKKKIQLKEESRVKWGKGNVDNMFIFSSFMTESSLARDGFTASEIFNKLVKHRSLFCYLFLNILWFYLGFYKRIEIANKKC